MEDYFEPALQVNHPDGNTSTLLKYKIPQRQYFGRRGNGFPGNLRATVGYTWTDDNRLQIRFEAISGRSYNNHDGIAFECQGLRMHAIIRSTCLRWLPLALPIAAKLNSASQLYDSDLAI